MFSLFRNCSVCVQNCLKFQCSCSARISLKLLRKAILKSNRWIIALVKLLHIHIYYFELKQAEHDRIKDCSCSTHFLNEQVAHELFTNNKLFWPSYLLQQHLHRFYLNHLSTHLLMKLLIFIFTLLFWEIKDQLLITLINLIWHFDYLSTSF